jgi:hypothetical protein
VCISLECDLLLIDRQQWSKWNFGPLERKLLHKMAINLDGWTGWISTIQMAQRFEHLPKLYLFHRTSASEMADFKMGTIARSLEMNEKMHRKTHPEYIAPLVFKPTVPVRATRGWDGDVQDWFTYKYPEGTYTYVRSNRSAKARNRGLSTSSRRTKRPSAQMVEEIRAKKQLRNKSCTQIDRRRSHRDVVVPDLAHSALFPEKPVSRNTMKRKRQDDEVVSTQRLTRKAAKLSCPKECTTPAQSRVVIDLVSPPRSRVCRPSIQSRDLSPTSKLHSASLKRPTFRTRELISPTPEPRIILSPTPEVPSLEANARFRCPFDGMDDADLGVPPAKTASPVVTTAFIDARVAFDSGGEARQTTSEQENVRTACYDFQSIVPHETVELLEDGLHCERNDPGGYGDNIDTRCETPNRPAIEEDRFIDSGYMSSLEVEENFTIGAAISQPSFSLNDNDDAFSPSKQLISGLENVQPSEDSNTEEEEYQPEKIIAERKTEEGTTQFLIQWVGYPEEKDWTWEDEMTLLDLPIITIWKEAQGKEKEKEAANVEYIVEKILGKRKFKGTPHYLVAWKGFPEVEDRTWEPCERLGVDVPHLVDAFEMKRRKK